MCFASSSENTGLFPQPAEPPRHVLRPAQPQTPNGKRALETPAATAMHLRQAPLQVDCITLPNPPRAVGAVFISPAFQRGVSAPSKFPPSPGGTPPESSQGKNLPSRAALKGRARGTLWVGAISAAIRTWSLQALEKLPFALCIRARVYSCRKCRKIDKGFSP